MTAPSRKTRVPSLTALLTLCLAAACSGGGTGDPLALTPTAAYAKTFAGVCDYYKRCNPSVQYLACEGGLGAPKADLAAEVTAGRMGFDAASAQQCIDGVAAAPCSSSLFAPALSAQCDAMFIAKVAPGGSCFDDEECVGGYCEAGATCPSKCKALAAAGADCSSTRCAKNLFCDTNTRKCTALKANGAECTSDTECQSAQCPSDASTRHCAPAQAATVAAGQSCTASAECQSGLYCKAKADHSGSTCVAQLAAGAACAENGDTAAMSSGCAGSLACAGSSFGLNGSTPEYTAGKCAAWSGVGGTCLPVPPSAYFGISGCMYGLVCGSDKKCATPPATGPCAKDLLADCARSSYCDSADSQCKAKKDAGAQCGGDGECKSGSCDAATNKCLAECTP